MELGQDFWPQIWPDPISFDPATQPNPVEAIPKQKIVVA